MTGRGSTLDRKRNKSRVERKGKGQLFKVTSPRNPRVSFSESVLETGSDSPVSPRSPLAMLNSLPQLVFHRHPEVHRAVNIALFKGKQSEKPLP